MKVSALTYNYNLSKLIDLGRKWAPDVYGGKDFIFEYSAASYATFLDKNRDLKLHIYTDDVGLMKEKMKKYDVPLNIEYIDFSNEIDKFIGSKYSFDVLTHFIHYAKSSNDFTVKIDNDLVFYGPLPRPTENCVFVWKPRLRT